LENNKKVVVIDDEVHIRRVIEIKLKKRGYQVMTAINGRDGLNLIKAHKPDVVISDIMMPEIDGKTLCEMTNVFKKEQSFLTIIMTCRISTDEESWINEMQDTVFMEKPFSPNKLVECINRYFGNFSR